MDRYLKATGHFNSFSNAIRSYEVTTEKLRYAQGWLGLYEVLANLTPAFAKEQAQELRKSLQSQVENASVAIEQNL